MLSAGLLLVWAAASPSAQAAAQLPPAAARNSSPAAAKAPAAPEVPGDYVIGPDDILTIVFWREKDLSGDVPVRPDGRISLPLINDVVAAGLTPDQLRIKLNEAAAQFVTEPNASVTVKAINSRKVFVTGQVAKQGFYPLTAPTTVLQMLATAGGLLEFADAENIVIHRTEKGKPHNIRFNFKQVTRNRNLQQNIELRPGDVIIVP
jgi:polysaccharide export outer membrane protein